MMASSSCCCTSLSHEDSANTFTHDSFSAYSSESEDLTTQWILVFQALACCREINASILQELIDAAPVELNKFCEKTMELFALRCLEVLVGPEDVVDSDAGSHVDNEASSDSLYSDLVFNSSASCVDVLYEIMHQMPVWDLQVARAELLAWDIVPFILHKRATVKCDLEEEQLKESVSEGTHPFTYYLRESVGLSHQIDGYLSDGDRGSCTYCENMEEYGNESSSIKTLPDKILPFARNEIVSDNEHVMGYRCEKQDDLTECDDNFNGCGFQQAVDGNAWGEDISSDSDGYHNEKIDLAARKHEFLSSRHTFDQSAGLTEKCLCIKCNEGGELLVCKTTTCQIMVHKSCLSTCTEIDAEGNFFCPFCAYSWAISEYHEAKKEVSLARKELAMFCDSGGSELKRPKWN